MFGILIVMWLIWVSLVSCIGEHMLHPSPPPEFTYALMDSSAPLFIPQWECVPTPSASKTSAIRLISSLCEVAQNDVYT